MIKFELKPWCELPPWIEYPDYEPHCAGWRMGGGEWSLDNWKPYWQALTLGEKETILDRYPCPPDFKWMIPI